MFIPVFSLLCACWQQVFAGDDFRYRDSLRSYIFEHGSAEVNCYLSYSIGNSVIDPLFGNNLSELAVLNRFLRYALEDTLVCVQQITITGYCSVDGTEKINERLSLNRTNRLLKYLDTDFHISEKYPVEVGSVGADWVNLRKLIASSSYKWKADALRIIDGPGTPDWKKMQLAYLGNGDAHKRLYEELYPRLRRTEIKIIYDVQCMKMKIKRAELPPPSAYAVRVLKLKAMNPPLVTLRRPWFALKTNMLFDAALMPNVEVEVPIRKRWSLNGELMFPWWLIDHDKYCLQILMGGLEGRYWLGNRQRKHVLTGHFLGLYAGGGKYDLQWDRDGYQGEFFIAAGVSYGYAMKIARNLRLEFNIGVGLLCTDYEYYHTLDNYQTLLWQNNGRYTWLGPTKAKISLVWMLNRKVKKGGVR
ncbi:DUF3575 domain-containing protein [Bacteroides sp.]